MTTENPIPKHKELLDLFDCSSPRIYVSNEAEDCFGSQIPYYIKYGIDYTQKEENKND